MWDTNFKVRSEFLRFGFEVGQGSVLALPHGPERLDRGEQIPREITQRT